MSLESTITDIISRLRQGLFPNEQSISQGIVLRALQHLGASTFETGQQLLARILAESRQKWQGRGKYHESARPEIPNSIPLPEGWTWATVEQLSTRVQYGSSAKTNEDATGVPVLRMGNIQEGKFDFDKIRYSPKQHDEFPELLLTRGDVIFNRTNSPELVGKTAVFKNNPQP